MKTLSTIHEFYCEMTSTTKRNEKIAILEKWKHCKEVVDLLKIIYDPMITFGVTSDGVANSYIAETIPESCLLTDILSDLYRRVITGHYAIAVCRGFAETAINTQGGELERLGELLRNIFDKDLKLGVDTKTINKAIPGLIDTFEVSLAFDITNSPTYMMRVESEPYLITRKLDGVRCITIVKNGQIKFYSRLGHEYTSLGVLCNALMGILPKDWNGVLDGELCVIDSDGKEDFKQAVSEVKRKTEQMQKPHYKVFDCLSLDEFYGKKESEVYSVRLENARKLLERQITPFASVLSAVRYSPNTFMRSQAIVAQKGYEGLILRSDTPYRSGRTSDLLKVKKFTDSEYVIEDFKGTTKRMKGLSGTMEPVECLGAVVIRHKGSPVDVGSGFSDAQRIEIWRNQEKYLGKTITVKYFEESEDAYGNPSLRFPIFKGFRENF